MSTPPNMQRGRPPGDPDLHNSIFHSPENSARERQAQQLRERFALPPCTAATVAELAFGGAA
jgi:hypothetical protein